MLRKPALVLIISLSILLTKVSPASAKSPYVSFYRHFSSIFELLRYTSEYKYFLFAPSDLDPETDVPQSETKPEESVIKNTEVKTNTPTPTKNPTTQTPTKTPTSTPQPVLGESASAPRDYIMNEINNYRRSHGLYEVSTDPYTCNFAKVRAQEISTSFNHDGFRNRLDSKTLPYPSFTEVSENIAMNTDHKAVVPMWIASSSHEINLRKNTRFVCVEQYGNYFAYEGWQP